ncbi:uncharacterized protein LOC141909718 [Tubulanus polymorphus]|uniref:uncharacterized protein LOC141909718 n=1 Tax=Tubulanus polymorphus TaxID=672921 RepID=UPI003DA44D2D
MSLLAGLPTPRDVERADKTLAKLLTSERTMADVVHFKQEYGRRLQQRTARKRKRSGIHNNQHQDTNAATASELMETNKVTNEIVLLVEKYEKLDTSWATNSKPRFTATELAYLAILRSKQFCLPIRDIYNYILNAFGHHFQAADQNAWRNAIRHTLSKTRCFFKLDRRRLRDGTGGQAAKAAILSRRMYIWGIVPETVPRFFHGDYRVDKDDKKYLADVYESHDIDGFWHHVTEVIDNIHEPLKADASSDVNDDFSSIDDKRGRTRKIAPRHACRSLPPGGVPRHTFISLAELDQHNEIHELANTIEETQISSRWYDDVDVGESHHDGYRISDVQPYKPPEGGEHYLKMIRDHTLAERCSGLDLIRDDFMLNAAAEQQRDYQQSNSPERTHTPPSGLDVHHLTAVPEQLSASHGQYLYYEQQHQGQAVQDHAEMAPHYLHQQSNWHQLPKMASLSNYYGQDKYSYGGGVGYEMYYPVAQPGMMSYPVYQSTGYQQHYQNLQSEYQHQFAGYPHHLTGYQHQQPPSAHVSQQKMPNESLQQPLLVQQQYERQANQVLAPGQDSTALNDAYRATNTSAPAIDRKSNNLDSHISSNNAQPGGSDMNYDTYPHLPQQVKIVPKKTPRGSSDTNQNTHGHHTPQEVTSRVMFYHKTQNTSDDFILCPISGQLKTGSHAGRHRRRNKRDSTKSNGRSDNSTAQRHEERQPFEDGSSGDCGATERDTENLTTDDLGDEGADEIKPSVST